MVGMLREAIIACDPDSARRRIALRRKARPIFACVVAVSLFATTASAQILRVVTYNIAEDTGSSGVPGSDLSTVLQGIGSVHLASHSQPIDVLALEELYGNPSVTLSTIVSQLNTAYPAANFVYDTAV